MMAVRKRHVRIWPPFFVGLFFINSVVLVYTKEVVLLDSSQEQDLLNWTVHTHEPPDGSGEFSNLGWMETSYNDDDTKTLRTYVSCYIEDSYVNTWLRMPFVDRKRANSLNIEIEFSMRKCSGLFDASKLQQCKETFTLYYYEAESDFANKQLPLWDDKTYTKMRKVAAEQLYIGTHDLAFNTVTLTIGFKPNSPRGVYFAVQDKGSCVMLKRVRVYYIKCPSVVRNYTFFPEIATGTQVVEQSGQCVDNSTHKSALDNAGLTYFCKTDGTWFSGYGECVCRRGYQGNRDKTTCSPCPANTYKWSEGQGPCQECPPLSYSFPAQDECTCEQGYYRSPTDPKSLRCTRPPSKPRNLKVLSSSPSSVTLVWDPPTNLGGRNDLTYRIQCGRCKPNVVYRPSWTNFNTTQVMLDNLEPDEEYDIIVFAENGVTNISGVKAHSAAIRVSTMSLGKVINLQQTFLGPRQLTISWDIPPSMQGRVRKFEVRYFPSYDHTQEIIEYTVLKNFTLREFMINTDYTFLVRAYTDHGWGKAVKLDHIRTGSFGASIVNVKYTVVGTKHITIVWNVPASIKSQIQKYQVKYYAVSRDDNVMREVVYQQNFTLKEFMMGTEYHFMVRCMYNNVWGEFSEPLVVTTPDKDTKTPIAIIVGAVVAVILCMGLATIMIIILLRRNRPACSEKKDCDAYSHVIQYPPLEHHINGGYGGLTMPLFPSPGSVHSSVRTYIDPHTYEDPNQAVREFTKEIDACHITIESVIGGGEFGDVCKGKLRIPHRMEMTVAIKTLKPGATEKNRLDFLTEASIMGQFDDPNVIFLEGVVTKSNPIMIVTEYMANGSLDTFLRNNDGKFTIIQLVGMMRGVASGMRYLNEMGFVHRDLAARNILVNDTLVCKVADFGLSRAVENENTDGAYTTTGGKIPVRWTAPEAIAFRKFTSSSDVWSYGVVMWEIVSYGERPYYNWSNQDVIKAVEKGYRLPPPMDCPEAIHQLMLDCWQKERSHRPKMLMIVKTLEKLIRAPELLRKQAKPRPHNFIDPSTPDMTSLSSVQDWLVSIKMERYLNLFLSAGLTTMEQIRDVTVRDLLNMGISLVGHQKKIMNSIQTFRAQTGENVQQHMHQAALV